MAVKMTDIHTHILPGIDDGAKNIKESLALIREQKNQGVNQIVFTPHFRFNKNNTNTKDIKSFVANRDCSLKQLTENEEFRDMNISFRYGAEVYYSVNLAECEFLDELCIAGTNYILIELPTQIKPHGLFLIFNNLINKGYTPVIAHIERYSYIVKDPIFLYELIENGCLAQINSEVLQEKGKRADNVIKMIKLGLVHFISSDCHSIEKRPPNLHDGYMAINKKMGNKYVDILKENSRMLFENQVVEVELSRKPKKIFGNWI